MAMDRRTIADVNTHKATAGEMYSEKGQQQRRQRQLLLPGKGSRGASIQLTINKLLCVHADVIGLQVDLFLNKAPHARACARCCVMGAKAKRKRDACGTRQIHEESNAHSLGQDWDQAGVACSSVFAQC